MELIGSMISNTRTHHKPGLEKRVTTFNVIPNINSKTSVYTAPVPFHSFPSHMLYFNSVKQVPCEPLKYIPKIAMIS